LSETTPIAAMAPAPTEARAAIARAANATGIDFAYLLGQARLESSLDPNARAATSSAAGLYQFTRGTWLATIERHGAEHGYGWAADPAQRAQALALRFDPQASALMAAELAGDNRAALSGVLGREPDASELYMAHFLGAGGAAKFLTALGTNPLQSAAALLPEAASANRAIFYDGSGAPRTVEGVMALMRARMGAAMEGAGSSTLLPSPVGRGWGWGYPAGVEPPPQPLPTGEGPSAPARPSMAATLAATFGGAGEAMPAHVRAAYGKLRGLGL
jgi:hypothetical protein